MRKQPGEVEDLEVDWGTTGATLGVTVLQGLSTVITARQTGFTESPAGSGVYVFRPPNPSMRVRPGRPTRTAPTAGASQQLRLGEDPVPASVTQPLVPDSPRDTNGADAVAIDGPEEEPGPWTPHFDEADDLDGLLSARSPLLSRAFRTADRASG